MEHWDVIQVDLGRNLRLLINYPLQIIYHIINDSTGHARIMKLTIIPLHHHTITADLLGRRLCPLLCHHQDIPSPLSLILRRHG